MYMLYLESLILVEKNIYENMIVPTLYELVKLKPRLLFPVIAQDGSL